MNAKADYPNDIWDMALTYLRIGDGFDPSLGFVPRKAINSWRAGLTYAPRSNWKWLRQMRNQLFFFYISDLEFHFHIRHNIPSHRYIPSMYFQPLHKH